MPFLTIFTAPKPFTQPHIALIQRNALCSWQALGNEVEVLVIGDEPGIAETTTELGIRHIPEVARNSYGTPTIGSLFDLARENGSGDLLAYVNADILLLPDFLTCAKTVAAQADQFLIVGQRWDLDIKEPLDFTSGYEQRLRDQIQRSGTLHPAVGSDYFIFPRSTFKQIPAMAVGRAGWDNWMIFAGRFHHYKVVDATGSINIIHQNHDYSHLPDGKPHYRLPETDDNVRAGGGRVTIFNLEDSSHRLKAGRLVSIPFTKRRFWREFEIFPLVRLHSRPLGWLFFAFFHPVLGLGELRFALSRLKKRIMKAL